LMTLPATEHDGNAMSLRPDCAASSLIAAGVMSGVPMILSSFSELWTVERPLSASAITAIPNAIRTAPAAYPPHSSQRRISRLLRREAFRRRVSGPPDEGRTVNAGATLGEPRGEVSERPKERDWKSRTC